MTTGDDDADDLIRPDDDGGRKLWQDQYTFRKEMLPSFVDEAFGKKVTLSVPVTARNSMPSDFLNWQKFEFHSVQLS